GQGTLRATGLRQAAPASTGRASRRDRISGAESARITPGSRSIVATTCSDRLRQESARASAIASYGPLRSSAEITPGRRRIVSAMGARLASVWISTYAFNASPLAPPRLSEPSKWLDLWITSVAAESSGWVAGSRYTRQHLRR